jgi:catechol 2,3-dioxygenase-like lactoylglutathione lyase family enzyme
MLGGNVMAMVLDHTIVPVRDREKSVEFYSRILGFEDLGEVGPFLAVRVNDTFNLDFAVSDDYRSIHYAFAMESAEFEAAFLRIQESGISYGDSPYTRDNMQGPGMTMGAKGLGKAVYFDDPDGHILEIKTY